MPLERCSCHCSDFFRNSLEFRIVSAAKAGVVTLGTKGVELETILGSVANIQVGLSDAPPIEVFNLMAGYLFEVAEPKLDLNRPQFDATLGRHVVPS
jgi:hypothetical protein